MLVSGAESRRLDKLFAKWLLQTCMRRMPRVAEPNLVAISPRSLSSCSTKADEESDSATAMTTASSTDLMAASCGDALKTCTSAWMTHTGQVVLWMVMPFSSRLCHRLMLREGESPGALWGMVDRHGA